MGEDRVRVTHHLEPGEAHEVARLLEGAAAAGHEPLADQKRLDLERGGRGFTALLARGADGGLAAYAQLAGERAPFGVEVVVDPGQQATEADLTDCLLRAAVAEVARRGGGPLRYWVTRPSARAEEGTLALGFRPDRDLLQLRVPLPLPSSAHRGEPPLAVRPFRPGADEAAWLAVNNRAFADHPEQGGWDLDALLARESEEWFDPSGFLVHEEGGKLAGSCWTKVHHHGGPLLGEIYVISVDPDFHQRGLGRALTLAGLDHLAATGVDTGMLYVDSSNRAATALYRSLGFTLDHLDRAYLVEVAPGGQVETPTNRPMP